MIGDMMEPLGRCSLCGGRVVIDDLVFEFHCESCGAVVEGFKQQKPDLPVVEMRPRSEPRRAV